MKNQIYFISLLFLFMSPQLNGQTNVEVSSPHPVKELFLSSIEAFNNGELELFLSNFSSDIKMYGTDGMYTSKDALRTRFKVIFQQFPNKRMEIPELNLEILSNEIVLVNFQWKLYPMGNGPAYSGIGTGLYVFKNNEWLEILEVESVTEVDEALMQK